MVNKKQIALLLLISAFPFGKKAFSSPASINLLKQDLNAATCFSLGQFKQAIPSYIIKIQKEFNAFPEIQSQLQILKQSPLNTNQDCLNIIDTLLKVIENFENSKNEIENIKKEKQKVYNEREEIEQNTQAYIKEQEKKQQRLRQKNAIQALKNFDASVETQKTTNQLNQEKIDLQAKQQNIQINKQLDTNFNARASVYNKAYDDFTEALENFNTTLRAVVNKENQEIKDIETAVNNATDTVKIHKDFTIEFTGALNNTDTKAAIIDDINSRIEKIEEALVIINNAIINLPGTDQRITDEDTARAQAAIMANQQQMLQRLAAEKQTFSENKETLSNRIIQFQTANSLAKKDDEKFDELLQNITNAKTDPELNQIRTAFADLCEEIHNRPGFIKRFGSMLAGTTKNIALFPIRHPKTTVALAALFYYTNGDITKLSAMITDPATHQAVMAFLKNAPNDFVNFIKNNCMMLLKHKASANYGTCPIDGFKNVTLNSTTSDFGTCPVRTPLNLNLNNTAPTCSFSQGTQNILDNPTAPTQNFFESFKNGYFKIVNPLEYYTNPLNLFRK